MIIDSFPNSQYRFEFFINYDHLTHQQVKAQKKCKALINLGYFDMAAYPKAKTKQAVLDSTACDFILEGKPIKPLQFNEFGLCINDNGELLLGTPQGQKNYCMGLPPQYINGEKYCVNQFVAKNGCSHVGFMTDGTPVWLLASKDEGLTNDEANAILLKYGCVTILRYDGSWSSQGDFGNGKTCVPSQTRIAQSYLLAYERNSVPAKKEDESVKKLIAIDAGHGMGTAGKRCLKSIDPKETREWFLNNRIACYVEKGLEAYDCETMRVDDITGKTDVSLAERVQKANNAKADVYCSVHANAAINGGSGGGICVFTCNNPSVLSVALQKAIYAATVAKTGLKGNRSTPMPKSNFYVIYRTNMPAILGEFGFMDSTVDTPIILTDDFARKCAEGIVQGLVETMKLEKKAESGSGTLYRVYRQVGTYTTKENAEAAKKEQETQGYASLIIEEVKK